MSFRLKLFAAIMFAVLTVATLTLYLADRNATEEVRRNADRQFRDAFTALREPRKVRQMLLADRCRNLAKSVRIRAALEESSAEDVYASATAEMRGVLAGQPGGEHPGRSLQAKFFRFLDARGAVLSPPPDGPAVGFLGENERRLGGRGAPERQEIGYLVLPDEFGRGQVCEVIATPIVAGEPQKLIGAIVLGFTPLGLAREVQVEGLSAGLWVNDELLLPTLGVEARGELAGLMRRLAPTEAPEHGLGVSLADERYLLRWQQLNPASTFPPAYEVCVFPLAASLARQQQFRWQILSAAAALLVIGLVASHLVASRLSAPIEKMAVDSAEHQAQRARAESELERANAELVARNAELQRALADLKATQTKVIQQERLSALGQMASGIAHDFNNALVPILGYAQLLQLTPQLMANEQRSREYLSLIETAASDAASVVRRLQQFYRPREDREALAAVDLNRVVEQAVRLTQPRWKSQAQGAGTTIEVTTELGVVPVVAGQEAALREALTNLIFNAVDALPRGGAITVRTRQMGESARLSVSDNGTGMTEAVKLRCLEPFFSTKGQRGNGLGLAMVFGIVQRHGGSLELESELGQGTTITLVLPLHPSPPVGASDSTGGAEARSLRVLVIEDEAMVRDLLVQALEVEGHRVTGAENGEEGMRKFLAEAFDLVITDMAMPGMSGEQVAALVKQRESQTPVILLTGFAEFLERKSVPSVDVVLSKPVDMLGLRKAVGKALGAARSA
ncbi:MAG: response regulator [Verrucomicrobia bacterium]|nr:response regulator [Verrucomicrobiota bacterium]